jgi:hypothetical protein
MKSYIVDAERHLVNGSFIDSKQHLIAVAEEN